jgi:DNA polymerase III delta subunit
MIYLFIGEDNFSKDTRLKRLKEEYFTRQVEEFNLDILYAQDTGLKELQERLLRLPFKAKKRVVVVKEGQRLKEESKKFLLSYAKKPYPHVVLVLDSPRYIFKDEFTKRMSRMSRVLRFRESQEPDTFALGRAIESKSIHQCLDILRQILENGGKPERIMGGLRYVWDQDIRRPKETRKKLRLLLDCDIAIKTGRLKAQMALERLLTQLCCF